MTPFGTFTFFGALLIYTVLPVTVLGLLGRARASWCAVFCLPLLLVMLCDTGKAVALTPAFHLKQIWIVLAFAALQGLAAALFLRWKNARPAGTKHSGVLTLAILAATGPLLAAKIWPLLGPGEFGFLGISYLTFRALDVMFSIHDGVIKQLRPATFLGYVFFFPAWSSGPIDRYRRFEKDWTQPARSRAEFLADLDFAIERTMRGFLYKFIIAALIQQHWLDHCELGMRPGPLLAYAYGYSLYLFFDFAGYSAFAIGLSRLCGIKTPENFDAPFLSRNIREFWTRWHISLSTWLRDHVHMRFLLAAGKGKWFRGRHTANYLGLVLTFGLMGAWHGLVWFHLAYGLYHAALLIGYDVFARWNKERRIWPDTTGGRLAARVLTFHAFAFGLLLFSGRLAPAPPPAWSSDMTATCEQVSGHLWDAANPGQLREVDILVDEAIWARVKADTFDQKLADQGMGSGKIAFHWPLDARLKDGKPHRIEARDTQTLKYLSAPVMLTCEREKDF